MRIIKFLSILLTFYCISCEREKNEPNFTTDMISVGDYSNMIVNTYDTILSAPNYINIEFDLDINKDSINDIRLISGFWGGSPSKGWNPFSKIMSLSQNVLILGYYSSDTLFLNRQTGITNYSGQIEKHEYFNFSYHRINDKDSIHEIHKDMFKIMPNSKNSLISKSDTFKADTITLYDDKYGQGPYPSGSIGDTSIIVYYEYYNDYYSFPSDEVKYIGIKIRDEEIEKLGWIKLGVMDKNKILLMESAIQK